MGLGTDEKSPVPPGRRIFSNSTHHPLEVDDPDIHRQRDLANLITIFQHCAILHFSAKFFHCAREWQRESEFMTPRIRIAVLALSLAFAGSLSAEERFVTLSNLPMGTREAPLVLRTYFPDPGLSREVMSRHGLGARARKYTPGKGDVDGFVDPIPGIPGAVGVNFGPELSYCWDTTECRLLYAWTGGFLDMTNYWGEPESGRRKGFGYIPEIVGELVYLSRGSHPLGIFDHYTNPPAPEFLGYEMVDGVPEFSYREGNAVVRVRIVPGDKPMSFVKHYRVEGAKGFGYSETGYKFKATETKDGTFEVSVQGKVLSLGSGAEEPEFSTDKANPDWGQSLYTTLGCLACHSLDGSRGHGPTFSGLFGSDRPIEGTEKTIKADEAYLRESIQNPMAKVVKSFPPGYMPPYPVDEKQLESLVLFIKTLGNE